MRAYRLKTPLVALKRDVGDHPDLVTLDAGTIIDVEDAEFALKASGLVDVTVDGLALSMFMQDLEGRAERIAADGV